MLALSFEEEFEPLCFSAFRYSLGSFFRFLPPTSFLLALWLVVGYSESEGEDERHHLSDPLFCAFLPEGMGFAQFFCLFRVPFMC